MEDVMLDLETMGNGPLAAIVAIGAVEFDAAEGTVGRKFYEVVSLESSVRAGGVMDASTVLWWLQQSESARSAFARDGINLPLALQRFSAWLDPDARVWGNGAAFDNVILASAYRNLSLPVPWKFWNDRCYRTVRMMHPEVEMTRRGVHHNAVDDAESQAVHLMQILHARGV